MDCCSFLPKTAQASVCGIMQARPAVCISKVLLISLAMLVHQLKLAETSLGQNGFLL